MSLPKAYEPHEYEGDVYSLWERSEAFSSDDKNSEDTFSLVVPPPNANGDLHMGHALTFAIQDVMARYNRLKGKSVAFIPGADHAGFETQVVYERELAKNNKSRFDFSREELYANIWEFVDKNKQNYQNQFRRLGASVDWSKFVFTLDDKVIKRAYSTFHKMWDEGLVYRGERLVNYCTFHGTGFADIEVDYRNEKGKLYYIKFPLVGKDVLYREDHLLIATTRPETMLGDTAVAVNPKDNRYRSLIGEAIEIPLTDRRVSIVADDMVDVDFGTGAVKITPAHDPNDFEVAERHNLPAIKVITEDGKIGYDAPDKYHGLTVDEARSKVLEDLEAQGLLDRVEDHENRVGVCYKCGTVIQPLLRDQWFINVKPLAKGAIEEIEKDKIKFYPGSKQKQLVNYLKNIRDWNISRQIAWGIPIPAFQNDENPDDWVFDDRVDQEKIVIDGKTYSRDPDVFDTWFSSSQWPFIVLDYPDGEAFSKYYPLSVMETASDILAQWVSRMIMFGLYVTDSVPFEKVYFHGLVLDNHGAKMSKSKGNVVNPMEVIDKYGTDALRAGVIAGQTAGRNQPFDESKIVGARNFCNKLWNIARFIEGVAGESYQSPSDVSKVEAKTPADHWMLNKLQQSIERTAFLLDNYRFSEAYETIYHTVWDDFADWYIESNKNFPNIDILCYGLETILKLAHPFIPFVTETIWQALPWTEQGSLLAKASWPEAIKSKEREYQIFEDIKTVASEARTICSNVNLTKPDMLYKDSQLLAEHSELITRLGKLNAVIRTDLPKGLKLTKTSEDCWIEVSDEKFDDYKAKLGRDKEDLQSKIVILEKRLNNNSYVNNAPKKLVDETRGQLAALSTRLAEIDELLDAALVD